MMRAGCRRGQTGPDIEAGRLRSGTSIKRLILLCLLVLCAVLLSACEEIDSRVVGSWVADPPDENDLVLGQDPRCGDIVKVVYRVGNDGDLAILYSYSGSEETNCYDMGPITVDQDRITLGGQGTFTVDGNTLTVRYDDGTVRTWTRE